MKCLTFRIVVYKFLYICPILRDFHMKIKEMNVILSKVRLDSFAKSVFSDAFVLPT